MWDMPAVERDHSVLTRRAARLVHESVERMRLDLRGAAVLTEAATGEFAVTAAIAAVAGARRVIAVTRDSSHGSAEMAIEAVRRFASLCGAPEIIEFHVGDARLVAPLADVVTNLGFVRPLDAAFVSQLQSDAVVALMCEGWECRPSDVDLSACRARGVPVLATNEESPDVDVFRYSGMLAAVLLVEAGIEVYKSRVVVYGTDRFAPVIARALRRMGARAWVATELRSAAARRSLANADALLCAQYASDVPVIGTEGVIGAEQLAVLAPSITVVQFAGGIDDAGLARRGIHVYPTPTVSARRMARTLAGLGPRPVVELHTAGLKVAELLRAAVRDGCRGVEAEHVVVAAHPVAQLVNHCA